MSYSSPNSGKGRNAIEGAPKPSISDGSPRRPLPQPFLHSPRGGVSPQRGAEEAQGRWVGGHR